MELKLRAGESLKGLPPALRKKKRYIAFKIVSDRSNRGDSTSSGSGSSGFESAGSDIARNLWHELWQNVLSLYGEWYGNVGLRIEHFDEKSMEGIIRCSRDRVEFVIAALTLITDLGNERVAVKTLGVSGTIKGCRRFLSLTSDSVKK